MCPQSFEFPDACLSRRNLNRGLVCGNGWGWSQSSHRLGDRKGDRPPAATGGSEDIALAEASAENKKPRFWVLCGWCGAKRTSFEFFCFASSASGCVRSLGYPRSRAFRAHRCGRGVAPCGCCATELDQANHKAPRTLVQRRWSAMIGERLASPEGDRPTRRMPRRQGTRRCPARRLRV